MTQAVSMSIDEASVRHFVSKAREVERVTGKSAAETVKFAFMRFTYHGRAAAKVSKTKRRVIDNPQWKWDKRRGRYLMLKYRQNRGVKAVPIKSKSSPKRIIGRRGLAKASFGWMRRDFTVTGSKWDRKNYQHSELTPANIARIRDRRRGMVPEISFENRLQYLLEKWPNIGNHAMRLAGDAMARHTARWMKNKWRRAFS